MVPRGVSSTSALISYLLKRKFSRTSIVRLTDRIGAGSSSVVSSFSTWGAAWGGIACWRLHTAAMDERHQRHGEKCGDGYCANQSCRLFLSACRIPCVGAGIAHRLRFGVPCIPTLLFSPRPRQSLLNPCDFIIDIRRIITWFCLSKKASSSVTLCSAISDSQKISPR